jgi:hypothetical protein
MYNARTYVCTSVSNALSLSVCVSLVAALCVRVDRPGSTCYTTLEITNLPSSAVVLGAKPSHARNI